LPDADFLKLELAAARQDLVEDFRQQQRIDDVPLQLDGFDERPASTGSHRLSHGILPASNPKTQVTNHKSQTNPKFQAPNETIPACFVLVIGISRFGFVWDLAFEIWDLPLFGFVLAAVGLGESPGAEDLGEQSLGRFGQVAFKHRADGLFDGIFDAFDFRAVVLNDGVGSARVAVAGLPDATGIDHQLVADFQDEGSMRVSDADDAGLDVLQPPPPELQVGDRVLIQGIARGGVHEQVLHAVERHHARDGRRREVTAGLAGQLFLGHGPRHGRQVAEADLAGGADVLGDAVIVIAADRVGGVFAHPLNAGRRLQSVVHQVAEHDTDVVRLLNRL